MTKEQRTERHLDRTGEGSFPASDPPPATPPPGSRRAERHEAGAKEDAAGEAKPKGLPHDDRYHQETAAARQHGVHPPERDHRGGGSK